MTHSPANATIAATFACLAATFDATQTLAGDVTAYPAAQGTQTPDYGRQTWISRGSTVYPTVPGTQTPDYGSSNRRMIQDGKVYQVIPGTSTPDYGSGHYIIRR